MGATDATIGHLSVAYAGPTSKELIKKIAKKLNTLVEFECVKGNTVGEWVDVNVKVFHPDATEKVNEYIANLNWKIVRQ